MRIHTTTRGVEVEKKLEELLMRKLSKLDRYFEEETECYITLTQERSRQRLEITIPYKGFMLRTERSSHDLFDSLEEVIEALEKQIHKNRTKLEKRLKAGAFDNETGDESAEDESQIPKLVRTKRFAVKPMDIEEAVLQMELIGHNFFVFTNAETEEVNVLYKRNDGNYGLIEPDYD